jgi:hypothetical protein
MAHPPRPNGLPSAPKDTSMISNALAVAALLMSSAGAMQVQARSPAPAAKPGDRLVAKIKSFECGDNCYLIVTDARGREIAGLCEAKACQPWNEKTEIPRKLVGRQVSITTGVGVQRDAEGNVMGKMKSFRKIDFAQ